MQLQYEGGQFFFIIDADGHPVLRQRGGMMPTRHNARILVAAREMYEMIQRSAQQPCYCGELAIVDQPCERCDARALVTKIGI